MAKKISFFIVIIVLALPSVFVFAADDNVGFSYDIQPYQGNTKTTSRYRSTRSTTNPWKVRLDQSWECIERNDSCITTFWLERPSGENVSKSIYKAEDQEATYTKAYSRANASEVSLTAENNNYGNTSYRVKGIWDEETW